MIKVNVANKEKIADGIVSLTLVREDNETLPSFSAGAHIDFHISDSLIRQYSLYNSESELGEYKIAVQEATDSRGGSKWIYHNLNQGDSVVISEPKNAFELDLSAKHHILLAGGIGITPILSMAKTLSNKSQSFELHYSSKSIERMAFYNEIKQSDFSSISHFYFSSDNTKLDMKKLLSSVESTTHIYICGSSEYVQSALATAEECGISSLQIHREFFNLEIEQNSNDTEFSIHLASSNQTLIVPADETVLNVLTEAGFDIPYACEQGVCGTCLVKVLDGEPDHRDSYLTDEEKLANAEFTPCCSRSKTESLTLDI